MSHLVRLKYATTQQFGIGGIPGGVSYTYLRVKVRNIATIRPCRLITKPLRFPTNGPTCLSPGWVDSADELRDAGARKVTEPKLSVCMNLT